MYSNNFLHLKAYLLQIAYETKSNIIKFTYDYNQTSSRLVQENILWVLTETKDLSYIQNRSAYITSEVKSTGENWIRKKQNTQIYRQLKWLYEMINL